MGGVGWRKLQNLGLPLQPSVVDCTVADGRICKSLGSVRAPIDLLGKVRLVEIHVVPDLTEGLLLGKDFWKTMEVVSDLSKDVWYFSSDLSQTVRVAPLGDVSGLLDQSSLTPEQKSVLGSLIRTQSQLQPGRIGKVKEVQHRIEISSDVRPIKQRYYPVHQRDSLVVKLCGNSYFGRIAGTEFPPLFIVYFYIYIYINSHVYIYQFKYNYSHFNYIQFSLT
jgi:hypothetical protein